MIDTRQRNGGNMDEQWTPSVGEEYADASEVPIKEWVGQALGAASMCWKPRPTTQEFDSCEAVRINDALLARIEAGMLHSRGLGQMDRPLRSEMGPLLGLATTRQLLEELAVRFEVSKYVNAEAEIRDLAARLPEDMLAYRTVDSQ